MIFTIATSSGASISASGHRPKVAKMLLFKTRVLIRWRDRKPRRRSALQPEDLAIILLIVGSMAVGWAMGGSDYGTLRSFSRSDVEVAVVAFSTLVVKPSLLFVAYYNRKVKRQAAPDA
jgi:hypothetical protein